MRPVGHKSTQGPMGLSLPRLLENKGAVYIKASHDLVLETPIYPHCRAMNQKIS